jgi:hypothetical protein
MAAADINPIHSHFQSKASKRGKGRDISAGEKIIRS